MKEARSYRVSYYRSDGHLIESETFNVRRKPKPEKWRGGSTWATVDDVTGGGFIEIYRYYFMSGVKRKVGG